MEKENYIVFQKYAPHAEWEQESVRLTLDKARAFLKGCKERNPDNYYTIMMEVEDI